MTKRNILISIIAVAATVIVGVVIFALWQRPTEPKPDCIASTEPTLIIEPIASPPTQVQTLPQMSLYAITPRATPLPQPTHPNYSWILPPIYSFISQFGDGMVRVDYGGRQGIICVLTGELVMPLLYDIVGDYNGYQQYMPARLNGRWGVINVEGEVVVPFDYVLVRVWYDYGVAMVRCDNWTYSGIVELYTGRVIVPFGLYHSIVFNDNSLARVTVGIGTSPSRREGFIDITTGEEVVPLIYRSVGNFYEGLATARDGDLWGFIDVTGNIVIPFAYERVWGGFANGTIAVSRNGLWGIIDTAGAYILPPTYDFIYSWWHGAADGFAAFGTIDPAGQRRQVGILNMQTGEEVVPAIYQGWSYVGEGIMLMRKYDYQNHDGNVLVNLRTGEQFPFPFAIGDDIGYCGPTSPGFFNGRSVVYIIDEDWNRIYGIVDNEGKEILSPIYNFIDRLPGGLFTVTANSLQMGIVNRDGQVALPLIYDEIEFVLGGRDSSHDITAIRMGGEWIHVGFDTPNPSWRMEGALWGFADRNGHLALPPILDFAEIMTIGHGTAAVMTTDGLWGLIRVYANN
ncbi:MAG: WG repeat-containing protein [Defluviitaleaceae bacterium]|nr:WG repeat-containing protein [Defluviitaleaceae bacterium]